jgi:CheY-like chemotaxis protein
VAEVGILIVDSEVAGQRALKNILDSEGWHVRIVTSSSQAMAELAAGSWNLVIVNVEIAHVDSPLFAVLKELAAAETLSLPEDVGGAPRKHIRVLFLLPVKLVKAVQHVLEHEGLPYSLRPYHLHDFLERVSELLVDAGAIAEPIRSIGGFGAGKRRSRDIHFSRDSRRGTMFANREDYHMSDEEMAEFERQQQEEHEKYEQELKQIKNRGQA